MNIVQIEHKGYPVRYTLEVPEGVKLHQGDIVQVKDKRGYHIVECVTDSHDLDDEVIDMIMDGKQVTASVTGFYKLTKFADATEKEIDLSFRIEEAMDKEEEYISPIFSDPLIGKGYRAGFGRCKDTVLRVIEEVGNGNK